MFCLNYHIYFKNQYFLTYLFYCQFLSFKIEIYGLELVIEKKKKIFIKISKHYGVNHWADIDSFQLNRALRCPDAAR